jgi:hypothetical protein
MFFPKKETRASGRRKRKENILIKPAENSEAGIRIRNNNL